MFAYAFTIFLSAFLLFLVQPMIGKYILPWFGGGAGVWATCLVFFQTALLAGYAYAHAINTWLSPRKQMIVHVSLLALSLAFLPIMPPDAWKPTPADEPNARILLLLLLTLGVPYITLSATGPLVQAWFARTFAGRSPYRLYALSNAGSLGALAFYPLALEPMLGRRNQVIAWSVLFALFAVLCAYCAVGATRVPTSSANIDDRPTDDSKPRSERTTAMPMLFWFVFPMCAAIALQAATMRLTEDVAPIPFLWVIPLAAYLLSFIICFEWPGLYRRAVWGPAILIAMGLTIVLTYQPSIGIAGQISLFTLALFACCMVCHGEVHRRRPASDRLTLFYLAIAAGAAAGGAFAALIAPRIFTRNIELDLAIFASGAFLLVQLWMEPGSIFYRGARRPVWLVLIMAGLACAVGWQWRLFELDKQVRLRLRNFYGTLSVFVQPVPHRNSEVRILNHGWIRHGAQILVEEFRKSPTLYYGEGSGIGRVLRRLPTDRPARVGIVGLGVGTLAAYGRHRDVFRFYEINPDVVQIATEHFTYLDDTAATIEIVPGDARLALDLEPDQHYDLLVLDAFSGDSIPVHLLTVEAFALYQRHLEPDGVIAVHISNKHLDLNPIAFRLAAQSGYSAISIATPEDRERLLISAQWVIVTRETELLRDPGFRFEADVTDEAPGGSLWTDDYASLLAIIR